MLIIRITAIWGFTVWTLVSAPEIFGMPRVITLEGELVNGTVSSITKEGIVRMGDKEWTLDGLRSIIPKVPSEVEDNSDGRVVLICGSEIAASGIVVFEEEVMFQSPGLGKLKLPIDSIRALRFGELRRGSRFQKGLLEWEAVRDFDSVFISGGAELQEVDGLIEEVDNDSLIFEREGKLQTIPLTRTYGAVLASPLLRDDERPNCVLSLVGGSRLKVNIEQFDGETMKLSLVEGVQIEIPWTLVKRVGIRSARLEYLSDLDILKEDIRPVIAPRRKWQRDLTVSGLPIKIHDQNYDKGLGFASGTYVTFPNEGPYDLFIAEIGIDTDASNRGDCEFVILGQGKELYRKRMRGGEPPQLIKVDITGFEQVTLGVDVGEDLDLADHADWADACFLQSSK